MKNGVPQFAIVLSGNGVYDGSEIHEAACTMLAIDEIGCNYQCFAPNIDQAKTLNHYSGDAEKEPRNVLAESARIARGKIKDLKDYKADDFDAIVFPGGFGAAMNLSNYASKGADCEVNPEVTRAIEETFAAKKIICAMCIAPVVIAKVLGKHKVRLTIGDDKKTAKDIETMGAIHEEKEATEVCSDDINKILTTPAYMLAESIREVGFGTRNLIDEAIELMELYGDLPTHEEEHTCNCGNDCNCDHNHDHECGCSHDHPHKCTCH